MSEPAEDPNSSLKSGGATVAPAHAAGGNPMVWTSEQLLGNANEAWIVHGTETYRLLRTRNQKLILIK